MAKHWLLKVAGQTDEQETVLIHVTPKGSNPLDLDLVATESTTVFKGKVRKRKLSTLTARNYNGSEDEWEAILRYALLEGQSSAISDDQKQSLEVKVSLKTKDYGKVLYVSFQNCIDDITQRIGAIELLQDDTEEISLFDWTTLAVDKQQIYQGELSTLSKSSSEDKATIAQLQYQLADLVRAKADHEEQMLTKFVMLLNAKKEKIRDQQRLLQTARIDKGRLKHLTASLDPSKSRNTTRNSIKRPAPDTDDGEDYESQAFDTEDDVHDQQDKMEVDSDRQTTPGSTESGADGIEDELAVRAKKSPRKIKKSAPTLASSPPRQTLPSSSKSSRKTRSETHPKLPEPPVDDDEETASEDDEL